MECIAAVLRTVRVPAGEMIFREHDPGDRMYIVATGRVQMSLQNGPGPSRVVDYLGHGDHFGDMAVLVGTPRTTTAEAVVDSELLELDLAHFNELLLRVPGFAANLSRTLVRRLHGEQTRQRRRRQPLVVALVNTSERTQGIIAPLAKRLAERGDALEVLTDRGDVWSTDGKYVVERIPRDRSGHEMVDSVRQRVHELLEHRVRVLIEISQRGLETTMPKLLPPCEEIWWLLDARFAEAACDNLRKLLRWLPEAAPRVRLVWILQPGDRYAPRAPSDLNLAAPDFKVVLGGDPEKPNREERQSFDRLVHHLLGTRLGLALGGGGARGLAHLGALAVLEREGITFDLVAGTSCGALMGLAYAGAWAPLDALAEFQRVLTPNWFVRAMPGGSHWYLVSKYRRGAWDAMLRPYASDARLEQMIVPLSTVAVDLISGREVVRDRGDAVHAVLESINLPVISQPILRDGMALIDGGMLNNVPADVLPDRGADFIVGIDIVARLRAEFGANTPSTPTAAMRRPSLWESLVRIGEVQAYNVTALRTDAVDVMITPDTARFDFSDFTRGAELGEAGQAAAEEVLPRLKQKLAELERR